MVWKCMPSFGVEDVENNMYLDAAVGGRDENRMFVRKISDDELIFGFRFISDGGRIMTDAEKARYPGYHAIHNWLITRYDLVGNELNVKQREIIESAMPHYSNRFGRYSVCIDGVYYKSLGDVEYVDDIPGY